MLSLRAAVPRGLEGSIMSAGYRVQLRTVGDGPTALGSAGPFSLVTDRPVEAGGGGLGFNGGQLLYLSIAACLSNDLYREAGMMDIRLRAVSITIDGDFAGRGAASGPIDVDVAVESDASPEALAALFDEVERVAEIPRTLREGADIRVHRS
jgi:putative redox protein